MKNKKFVFIVKVGKKRTREIYILAKDYYSAERRMKELGFKAFKFVRLEKI
jgi:hypothetical protein